MSLYEQLKAAGVPIGNHESDLYFKDTPKARAILEAAGVQATTFLCHDGSFWREVPFSYDPWWEAKAKR